MRLFPVICGPTASGKSALALALAERLRTPDGEAGAEIVSADAFHIYRGMDIGTAKPTRAERAQVPHHLIDLREPTEPFSVEEWLRLAEPAIDEIRDRGRLPIVVGGTHLYAKALLDGLFEGPAPDPALRESLQRTDSTALRAQLERADPAAAERIHPNDLRRTVRALEVFHATGRPISEHQRQWDREPRGDVRLVALDWEPGELNRRINARVKRMVADGLVEEARGLWEAKRLGRQAKEAIGYKQLLPHFEGKTDLEDAIERIKIESRRLAKNQRTWIRRILASPRGREAEAAPVVLEATGRDVAELAQVLVEQALR